MTYPHKGLEILELMRQLHAMPERQVIIELRSLDVSLYIYRRNRESLRRFLEFVRRDPSNHDLWHQTTIKKSEGISLEIARLLQNYIASVKSLVDHTREQTKRLYADGEFPEYQARVNAVFRDDPEVQFVQCLRNILLHSLTAPLVFHGKMVDEGGPAANEVGLERDAILEQRGWLNSRAKEYVRNASEVIDLPKIVDDYHKKVEAFYAWYELRQLELHADAIGRYRAKEEELFALRIEDDLDQWFDNPDPVTNSAPSDRGLFIGILDLSEFEIIEALPEGSVERADAAIEMLREHCRIPRELEKKIRRAYSDPNFFRFRDFRPPGTEDSD